MDSMLEQLFSMATIILCLMIWILVWLQRRVVEYFWKGAKDNKFWNELLLPLGPIATGGFLVTLVSSYPVPDDFATFGPRMIFGAVCGLASAHVYKILKKFLAKKEGLPDDAPASSLLPTPDTESNDVGSEKTDK